MCGGGDEGGVDDDKCLCRCTSPKNTLPMAVISASRVGTSERAKRQTMAVRTMAVETKRGYGMGACTHVGPRRVPPLRAHTRL